MADGTPAYDDMTLPPIERLRARVLSGQARLAIIGGALIVWLMDAIVSRFLIMRGSITGQEVDRVMNVELLGTVIFVATVIALIIAVVRGAQIMMLRLAAVYLGFSVIQVVLSVGSMLTSVTMRRDIGLTSLWDVGAMYLYSVTVFTFVYVLDGPGHAQGRVRVAISEGEPAPTPNIVDYLFISLNVNSTYGPTSEAVMSRPTKLIMGLQVILAIVMLTVLIARAVSATT